MADDKKQRLVYSVIEFLNDSIADGTVKEDDKEGLEVAIQCIGEAFGVDPESEEQAAKLTIKPAKLLNIFDVFLKTRERTQAPSSAAQDSSAASSSSTGPKGPSEADKAEAEKLKQKGNGLMSSKKYDEAIDEYTKAIDLDPTNPVFYSNRAAAHASKGDHLSAIGDAEQAISIDPKFVKAYSRLGHAQFSIGDYSAAVDAFERGLKLDPTNAHLKSSLESAKGRLASEGGASRSPAASPTTGTRGAGGGGTPNLNDLLGSLGGGAGGGGGGMPDLSSLLSNPAIMQMASQLAQNGGLDQLMQSPDIANLANRFRSGNMPSMEEMMNNPALRNLAQQYGGGAGL
ncbi:cytoplasmic protein [Coprinopsis cinerea AmutBmut pab1-1]|nr:cytoplasmic protein [Coprinopsis cinerea AmutBmut pab1-1]